MIKVLHIRNEEENRIITTELLRLANYQVIISTSGKEGYQAAIKENPDIIVCDFEIKDIGGLDFLYLVQRNSQLKDLPVIFLADQIDRQQFRKSMEMGADDVITRPTTELELIKAIESRLNKRQHFEEKTLLSFNTNLSFKRIDNQEALEELKKLATLTHYFKKQRIYTEGHHPQSLFYVHSGKARAYRTGFLEKELTTTLYSQGDFIGYKALLGETKYRESTETLEESEIGIIKKEDFSQLLEQHPSIAHTFLKILANNINEKEDLLIGLAYDSLRKRVANALLLLLKKYQSEGQFDFTIQISRENLARMAGTTTESLIRTLSEFKEEGLVEAKAGMVKILNEEKLRELVN